MQNALNHANNARQAYRDVTRIFIFFMLSLKKPQMLAKCEFINKKTYSLICASFLTLCGRKSFLGAARLAPVGAIILLPNCEQIAQFLHL